MTTIDDLTHEKLIEKKVSSMLITEDCDNREYFKLNENNGIMMSFETPTTVPQDDGLIDEVAKSMQSSM